MAERRNSSTEILLALVAACALGTAGLAWKRSSLESVPGLRQRSAQNPDDVSLRERLVKKLVEAGRADEAVAIQYDRLKASPADTVARRSLVQILVGQKRFTDAIAVMRQWLADHADDDESRERLADLLVMAGQLDEAQQEYRRVIAQRPANVTAPYHLANVYVLKRDTLNAQRILEESLRRNPDDPAMNEFLADLAVKSLGELAYPAVQPYYEKAQKGDPARPGAALGLARIYVSQGRITDAAKVLELPASLDRKNGPLHILYADVLSQLQRFELASTHYSMGTTYDSRNADAYYRWGKMLTDRGGTTNAETVLNTALNIYTEMIQKAESRGAGAEIRDLKRHIAECHVQLALAFKNQRISIAAFMKEFEKAIDTDPSYHGTYIEVAKVYLEARQEGTAEKWFKDAVHVAPGSTEAKEELAKFYLSASDPNRRNITAAIDLLAQAVSETESRNVRLLVGLASALASVGRYEEAANQMDAALAATRTTPLPRWQLEALAGRRQDYFLASLPPLVNGEPRFGIDGRKEVVPGAEPWPDPLQPDVFKLAKRPMNLTVPPGPGNALDPALYMGDNLMKPATGEFNGMPILDILK